MDKLDRLIEVLGQIAEEKEPSIPYQLHAGIRQLGESFGSYGLAKEFFEKLKVSEL